jgi:murein DD-endopeptidase MepM/ murein hydrolase activator NlpD
MRNRDISSRLEPLAAALRRAYRYSEIRKLQLWLKGKTLHWAVYLLIAAVTAGGTLGLHHYWRSFIFVVYLNDQEVGLVRDAGEIERFIADLMERCGSLYGMKVEPEQQIALLREYRPGCEEDAVKAKEALREKITLVTGAYMVTVDAVPVLPVASEEDIATIIGLLSSAYVRTAEHIKLLEVFLVEEIAGNPCSVCPELVRPAEEVAALLLAGGAYPERLRLASRGGSPEASGQGDTAAIPLVHVQTVEEVTAIEAIPFSTAYTYTNNLWYVQSRVAVPGKNGRKQVVYHVTRENGREIARQKISEDILEHPTTQVLERGTARVPSMGTGRFIWPLQGGGLTSGFGWRWGQFHYGIDIGAVTGTPVLAADKGVVIVSEYGYMPGYYVVIYHGDYWTLYLHHSANLVRPGDVVEKGQVIARVGSTGNSSGSHLHFEIRRDNGSGRWSGAWNEHTALDPLSFFRP